MTDVVVALEMAIVVYMLLFAAVLVVAMDLMFRLGRRLRGHYDDHSRSHLTTVQAATLGLLALMLGFTMSMADARYSKRREVNLLEAAAVSTTFLRTDLLPEPERSRSRELMRRYVAERRAYYRAAPDEVPAVMQRTAALEAQLWQNTASAVHAHPDWDSLSTYVEAMNNMLDLELFRSLVMVARLPREVLVVTMLVAAVGIALTGFMTGVTGARSVFALYILPVLIALACAVIVDLDRSRFGFVRTGDAPMERVEREINAAFRATSATR